MKDIWGGFLGQTLTGVIHVDRPDSGVVKCLAAGFLPQMAKRVAESSE